MLNSKFWRFAVSIAAVASAELVPSDASASPPSGVTVENLAAGGLNEAAQVNHDMIKFQTKDPTALRVQRLTFAAGGTTGWHHHPGTVTVTVQSGSVTLWHIDCSKETYGPGLPNGNVFVEGDDNAHQATSESGATVYANYVVPSGSPLRVEEQPPFCAASFDSLSRSAP